MQLQSLRNNMFRKIALEHVRLSTVLTAIAVFGNLVFYIAIALGYQFNARTPLEVETFVLVCFLVTFFTPFFTLISLAQYRKRQYMYEFVISLALSIAILLLIK